MARPSYLIPSDLLKEKIDYRTPLPPPNISAIYMTRNFLGRVVNILTTPTLIHDAPRFQNIMITNPASSPISGLVTSTGLVTSQVGVAASGNSQAAPIGVANYLNMHLLLNITAIAAGTTWSFINQIIDPVTLNWVDSQVLIAGVTPAVVAAWTNAEFYASIGAFGVGERYAIRWTLDAGAGAITFTLSYILKQGLAGSPLGVSQVVFIGSNSGVQVASGYPILESSEKVFQVAENTQIWGIAQVATPIRVFELT